MSSISSHNSSMGKKFPISSAELQPGMVVEFSYRKDSVGKPETKNYTVMIVDPSFKRPQDKEPFTHAVNLAIAPRAALIAIAKKTGTTIANGNLKARRIDAEKLIVEGQPRQFYQSTISNLIKGSGKGSYRTFKTKRLQGISLIDYTFPSDIQFTGTEELTEDEN